MTLHSAKVKFLLRLGIESSSCEDVEHLTGVISINRAVVQVTKRLPQGLAFELSLLETFSIIKAANASAGSSCTCMP